ncbi:hypothetical protein [Natrialbaceae archaeon AArc-T1-2]|uniref:hypothetical protein n=1 Tax=Natrialbaceae archaeon AArc-T1-2 TaxID=3053904 RepID=UPI00255A8E63|nr:hypothetical protein [Natrialbaceae archaeon AArc-T1-2]WIV68025.1 hypothetical protein QQ977_04655 [Natrialbaceae archaeon AArc-T1-2]
MTAEPSADIPDFLRERLDELGLEALRATAEFARNGSYVAPEEVPDDVVEAFALQDDETLEAVATYVEELGTTKASSIGATATKRDDDAGNDDTEGDDGGWATSKIRDWRGR